MGAGFGGRPEGLRLLLGAPVPHLATDSKSVLHPFV